ncbi:hypothetical protein PDIDSM_8146 [Penicillium digitatum]|nr:hypothetical protein PDIDSM_8146 [Penicillium digitatum]
MPSGQVYLEGCLRLLEWCNDKIQVELRWVPAHEGIPGMRLQTCMQKKQLPPPRPTFMIPMPIANTNANTNDNTNVNTMSTTTDLSGLPRRSEQECEARIDDRVGEGMDKGGSKRTARRTRRMIEVPSKSNLTYWKGLRKATTSVLIQLRTGIIGLAEYLSKIKRSDSPRCQCDLGNQSVKHVLLECPLLKELRSEMVEELFMEGVSTTLGEQAMLTEVKAAPIVAKFMIASGLLGQFQSVDSVAMGKEQGRRIQNRNQPKTLRMLEKQGTHHSGRAPGPPRSPHTNAHGEQRTLPMKTKKHGAMTEPIRVRPAGVMQQVDLAVLGIQGLGDSGAG